MKRRRRRQQASAVGFVRRWLRRLRWLRRAVMVASVVASVNAALKRRHEGGTDLGPTTGGGPAVPASQPSAPAEAAPDEAWVAAEGNTPPPGYPVKAKLDSGIFHVPGGLSYDRTNADRWYRSAEDARADGLRQAKR